MRTITNPQGSIVYLNSGDWVENLSALEYTNGQWSIYKFSDKDKAEMELNAKEEEKDPNMDQLFDNMLNEFKMMKP